MLIVNEYPIENTRRPDNVCLWEAVTTVDGTTFVARSRRGAPFALARILMAAGVADQPMQVHSPGIPGYATYASVHRLAAITIVENASVPVRRGRYVPFVWGSEKSEE